LKIFGYSDTVKIQGPGRSSCGFCFGSEQLIEGLDRVKNSINSYTLDRLALIGAEEAIKDHEYFCEIRDKIINTREWVSKKLSSMGFKVIESKANFIFISHPKINGRLLFEKYKENNILVRHFNSPRIDNFFVSVSVLMKK